MKTVEKLLIWSYLFASVTNALPITSKPLENNLDHFIREAGWYSHDSRHDFNRNGPYSGPAKKITPKSIFITPNFNNLTSQICPPGFKIDEKGQCIHVININQEDLLVTRLQSILSQTTDNAENGIKVDYYDYDEDNSESNEFPYQVNLPLVIDTDIENTDDEKILESFFEKPATEKFHQKQQPTFDSDQSESIEFVSFNRKNNFTTNESSGTVIDANIQPHRYTAAADSNNYDLSNSTTYSTVVGENIANTERLDIVSDKNVPLIDRNVKNDTTLSINNTEVEYLFDYINKNLNSTTTKVQNITLTDGEYDIMNISNKASAFNGTSKENMNEFYSEDIDNIELTSDAPTTESVDLIIDDTEENITIGVLDDELDESGNFTSDESVTNVSSDYISNSDDIEITTEDMSGDGSGDSTLTSAPVEFVSENPIDIIENLDLKIQNETEKNKKDRDTIIKQEQKFDSLESIDSFNRFVYHHLPAQINLNQVSTTENPPPLSVIHQLQSNQVEMVQKIVEETKKKQEDVENKIRFPNVDEEMENHPLHVTKSDMIKFPGESTNRFPTFKSITRNSNNNNFKTEKLLSASQNLPTATPPIWFVPNGFEVDKSGPKPNLLKFWSRMPLIRDPAMHTSRQNTRHKISSPIYLHSQHYPSVQQHSENPHFPTQNLRHRYNHGTTSEQNYRENSKSPGESFYKEVSAQDNYKVIGQRNLQYSNRR